MTKTSIDYYIFIDYSENLIGYNIIEKEKIPLLIPKIVKFRHFKEQKHQKSYLLKIKREIENTALKSFLRKQKILPMKDNLIVFTESIEFIKNHDNCIIFMSVDNNQFFAFMKLLSLVPHRDTLIVRKESELKRDSLEYQLSLIIDTMLNIERLSK